MVAGVVILFITSVIAVGTMIAGRRIFTVLRRRYERRMWDELVSRYQELDRDLDEVWRSW